MKEKREINHQLIFNYTKRQHQAVITIARNLS